MPFSGGLGQAAEPGTGPGECRSGYRSACCAAGLPLRGLSSREQGILDNVLKAVAAAEVAPRCARSRSVPKDVDILCRRGLRFAHVPRSG